jgi:hypothetical protein
MKLVWISLVVAVLAGAFWIATRRPLTASIAPSGYQGASTPSHQGPELTSKPSDSNDRRVDERASLRIVVVTKEGSRPVAHARVLIEKSEADPGHWQDEVARYGSSEGALAHGMGDSYETDEHGELLVPVVDRTRVACAWGKDLFGKTAVASGTHDASIEMKRAQPLDIEVVDARGAPVPHVCIAFLAIAGAQWESLPGAWTDANGRVHVEDLEAWRWYHNTRWRIGGAYGATQPEFIDLDERNFSSPLHFVLGATGDVELALADEHGQPLVIEAEYGLYVDNHRVNPARGLDPDGWHSRFTNDGRALFEHVALDLPLSVHVWAMGFDFDEPNDLRAPSLSGQTRRITLRCKSVRPIVRGRIVDSNDRPLAGVAVVAKESLDPDLKDFAEARLVFEASTEDDGTFECVLDHRGERSDLPAFVIAVNDENRPTLVAHVAGSQSTPDTRPGFPAHFELGTVLVQPLPILASGVVVDSQGRPVAGAHIETRETHDTEQWRVPPSGVECTTDRQGRFIVAGLTRAARIELRAQEAFGGDSEPVVVEVGSNDARLVLNGSGRISARFILPEDLSIDDLDLSLSGRAAGPEDGKHLVCGYQTNPENGFVTSLIEPGRWSLTVHLGDGSELLPPREGIVVDAGASVDLGEIDLRPCFRSLGIEIVDERGVPLEDTQWVLFDANGDRVGDRRVASATHRKISVPPNATRACVNAPGFQTHEFDDLRDGATCTMRKSLEVRLRWATSLPRIEPPLQLFVRTRFSADSTPVQCARGVATRVTGPTDPGSEIPIDVSLAGKWIVTYELIHEGEASWDGTSIGLRPAQVLDVADLDVPQTFTIEVDASVLARAIAGVRPR